MGLNLGDCLRLPAQASPGSECLVLDGVRLSYAEVDAAARRVAGVLRTSGVARGDRVLMLLPNVPQFAIIYHGILYAGATVVPINPLLRPRELAHIVHDTRSRVAFAFQDVAETALDLLEAPGGLHQVFIVEAGMKPAKPPRGESFLRALFSATEAPMLQTDPQDIAVIMYTAAQHGRQRGAMLSHFNLFQGAQTTCTRSLRYFPEDRLLAVLPLFHGFGQTTMLNAALLTGCAVVCAPRFDAGQIIDTIERERITLLAVVPTMLHLLVAAARDARPLPALRCVVVGGAKLNLECARQFEALYGAPVLEGYGLTETSPVVAFNSDVASNRPGSVGKPVWGCEVVVASEEDELLPPGQEGEILVQGHNVFQGYLNDPEGSRETLHEGWLRTGDLGYVDAEGYVFLTGLKKDMILRAGMNVYPKEVEGVLESHPGVLQAAVVGLPDAVRGEDIKAYIVPVEGVSLSESELKSWCRDVLSSYKCPRRFEFVEALPRKADGGVDKAVLRAKPAHATAD